VYGAFWESTKAELLPNLQMGIWIEIISSIIELLIYTIQ
jgi:hypothetical protein